MAKTRTTQEETVTAEPVMEGQEAMSFPTVADEEMSQLMAYAPPAESQFRRKLTGPELMLWVKQYANLGEDEEERGKEVWEEIASLGTVDAVLRGQGKETTKGRERIGVIFRCDSIRFLPSTKPKGCPFFVLAKGVWTDNKQTDVVNLGGWWVVGQLAQMHYAATLLPADSPALVPEGTPGAIAKESYPFYFRVMEEETGGGNTRRWLAPAMS